MDTRHFSAGVHPRTHRGRHQAADRWELEYLVPQARNPDDVFTPVSDIVTRLDRSKMVLTSHDATDAQAAPGRIRNF